MINDYENCFIDKNLSNQFILYTHWSVFIFNKKDKNTNFQDRKSTMNMNFHNPAFTII